MIANPRQENGIIRRLKEELQTATKERDEWKGKYEELVQMVESCGFKVLKNGVMYTPDK